MNENFLQGLKMLGGGKDGSFERAVSPAPDGMRAAGAGAVAGRFRAKAAIFRGHLISQSQALPKASTVKVRPF